VEGIGDELDAVAELAGPFRMKAAAGVRANVRGACSVKIPTLASALNTRYRPSSPTPASRARSATERGPPASRSVMESFTATWSAAEIMKPVAAWKSSCCAAASGGNCAGVSTEDMVMGVLWGAAGCGLLKRRLL
jgi:hypothetical protein